MCIILRRDIYQGSKSVAENMNDFNTFIFVLSVRYVLYVKKDFNGIFTRIGIILSYSKTLTVTNPKLLEVKTKQSLFGFTYFKIVDYPYKNISMDFLKKFKMKEFDLKNFDMLDFFGIS